MIEHFTLQWKVTLWCMVHFNFPTLGTSIHLMVKCIVNQWDTSNANTKLTFNDIYLLLFLTLLLSCGLSSSRKGHQMSDHRWNVIFGIDFYFSLWTNNATWFIGTYRLYFFILWYIFKRKDILLFYCNIAHMGELFMDPCASPLFWGVPLPLDFLADAPRSKDSVNTR